MLTQTLQHKRTLLLHYNRYQSCADTLSPPPECGVDLNNLNIKHLQEPEEKLRFDFPIFFFFLCEAETPATVESLSYHEGNPPPFTQPPTFVQSTPRVSLETAAEKEKKAEE